MGQKVHPVGFRMGVIRTWSSRWFADRDYAEMLHEDLKIRKFVKKELYSAGVAKIDIERPGKKRVRVNIHAARPGIVIGRRGAKVDELRGKIEKIAKREVMVNILEVKRPETNAQLVAEAVASQLEKRVSFRRAMKRAIDNSIKLGVQGIRISCAGRLGGAEIARTDWQREGRVPLHTLRADIDFGFAESNTTFGKIGIKVWIFRGEVLSPVAGAATPEQAGSKA